MCALSIDLQKGNQKYFQFRFFNVFLNNIIKLPNEPKLVHETWSKQDISILWLLNRNADEYQAHY